MTSVKRIAGLFIMLSAIPVAFAQDARPHDAISLDAAPDAPMGLCALDAKPFESARDAYLCIVEEYHPILNCAVDYFDAKGLTAEQIAKQIALHGKYPSLLKDSIDLVDENNSYLKAGRNAGDGPAGVQSLLAALGSSSADETDESLPTKLKKAKAISIVAIYFAAETDGECPVSDNLQRLIKQRKYADL